MSQSHLVPCPSCARHVRAFESSCPFCRGALSETLRAIVPARRPTGRLTRAALYTFGATSLTLAAACSSSSTQNGSTDGSADVTSSDSMGQPEAVPHYGCPPGDCNPVDAAPDTPGEFDVVAAYGAPGDAFPVDSPEDAGSDGDSGFTAAYGSPSPDH